MPRTTLDLDGTVLEQLRRRGAAERKSMGQVASELLAGALAGPDRPGDAPPFAWKSANLGVPKVDLEDKEELRRILDRDA